MEPNTATIISGLLSFGGGFVGALWAYKAATKQTETMIEHDKETRVKQREIEKLEELKSSIISCQANLKVVYQAVEAQKEKIQIVIDKKYTIFRKETLLTTEIENDLIKGVMSLQQFIVVAINNKNHLPIRVDDLELLSASHKMERILNDFLRLHILMTTNKPLTLEEFEQHFINLVSEYEGAKSSMESYVFNTTKLIEQEIKDNL